METRTYGIKPAYRANPNPPSLEGYWDEGRVEMSGSYQYFVYRRAMQLLRRHHLTSVMDVGSGPGTKVKELIWPHCRTVVLVDHPTVSRLAQATLPDAEFVGLDLETTSLDLGRQFQLIICADVIEHLLDPDPCVAFIARHLAADGFAVISTPERDIIRGPSCDHCPKPEHVREWNRGELAQYLRQHGFEVLQHLLYPLSRLSALKFAASQLLPRTILPPYWCGNQIAIARRSGPATVAF